METNPTPAPRHRRADRYRQEDAALPQATPQTPVRAVPPPARPAAHTQTPVFHEPPPQRPEGIPAYLRTKSQSVPQPTRQPDAAVPPRTRRAQPDAQTRTAPASLPRWMTACIVALCFACLGLFTAQSLMNAYLVTQQRARDDAHAALVSAHPLSYTQYIDYWADAYGLQPAYVASIILNESSYRANAQSGVGARGLMQLMEGTAGDIARELALSGYSFDLLWDAETNIRFGCHYLRKLADMFGGDPASVTAAYNAGYGNVRNWLASREVSLDGRSLPIDRIPFADTKLYAGRVTKAYGIYDALYYHAFNPLAADSAAPAAAQR